jgi:hypothetical protein
MNHHISEDYLRLAEHGTRRARQMSAAPTDRNAATQQHPESTMGLIRLREFHSPDGLEV